MVSPLGWTRAHCRAAQAACQLRSNLGVCAAEAAQSPRSAGECLAPPSPPPRGGLQLVRRLPPASLREGGSRVFDKAGLWPAQRQACWSPPLGGGLGGAVGHARAPSRRGRGG